ncbi:MAG: beta-lactamase family protein [Gammaproteobacteria bacterium]|nr:beta-lactamase family protein [Gammaproteobacteria bacterium]
MRRPLNKDWATMISGFFFLFCFSLSSADIDQSRLDAIAADMQSRIDEERLSGAVLMIAQDGELQMSETFGFQNVEDKVPMSMDTIFRIFSMTKPITGTALMILHDEGKFQFGDPVSKYIPELANVQVFTESDADGKMLTEAANHEMTIQELMTHTGGIMYVPPLSSGPVPQAMIAAGIMRSDILLAEQIDSLGELPLGYQPGTQWEYSYSVDVQGYLVEVLSGQTFDVFLEERIFSPLGMLDTGFFVPADKAHRLARQYNQAATGGLTRTDTGQFLIKPKFFSGGGGLTSTASDYMKFAQMHLNMGELNGVRILSEDAIALMRSNLLPEGIDNIANIYPGNVFGVDFAVVSDSDAFNGTPEGTHWWWGIAGSWFWIDPVQNIVFVGMIQNDNIFYSIQTHGAMRGLLYK